MRRRCWCACHQGPLGDAQQDFGVDVCDALEAAVACASCSGSHIPALDSPRRANAPLEDAMAITPGIAPEPATGCYEDEGDECDPYRKERYDDDSLPPGGSVDDTN